MRSGGYLGHECIALVHTFFPAKPEGERDGVGESGAVEKK